MTKPSDTEETSAFMARQAEWTAPMRRHLYRKAWLARRARILDAGCGTGEVTAHMASLTTGLVTGADSDAGLIQYAASKHPGIEFVEADCARLPFPDSSFDLVTCHFLLMWVPDAQAAVREMVRVLEPGGALLAAAEPDYGGLVEYPEHPEYSRALREALELQGADPLAGRKLAMLFRASGLGTRTGVSATPWEGETLVGEFDSRLPLINRDLEMVLGRARVARVLEREREYLSAGKLYMVPLFWALGVKPLPSGVD